MPPERPRVLFLVPHYQSFVKGPTEALAPSLGPSRVLVRHNRVADIAGWPGLGAMVSWRRHAATALIDRRNTPANLNIELLTTTYLRPDGRNPGVPRLYTRRAKQVLGDWQYDLIHAHFLHPMGAVGANLKAATGRPLVVTGHGFDVYDLPFRPGWHDRVLNTLAAADRIITVSKRNQSVLIDQLGVSEDKVRVIPNGANPRQFKPIGRHTAREKLGLPADRPILLSVGHLSHVKGQDILLEAIPTVLEQEPDALFVLVGEGPRGRALKALAHQLGISDAVIFAGHRPHHEIPVWMASCDVLALPSRDEGNPTVLFEALTAGRPVASTRVGAVPDVVRSDELGYLCNPGDPHGLATVILRALRSQWSEAAIRKHAEHFTWDRVADDIMQVYREVLE